MYGPVEAKRHDAAMLRMSGLMPMLEENMTLRDGTIFSLYGDPAYPLRPHLIAPFRGAVLSQNQMIFNKRMSKLRSSVEWSFGKILSLFAFVDYKKKPKTFSAVSCQILSCCSTAYKLPHMLIWKRNK
jgi:hypothetical protein